MAFGLTFGEAFVAVFIVVAVISATWWPRAGGAIAVALFSGRGGPGSAGPGGAPSEPQRAEGTPSLEGGDGTDRRRRDGAPPA